MAESLYSPSWYRVSKLQPRLRAHAQIHQHYYHEELWYVLQDHVTGQFYRFTPVAYHIIGLMDGKLSVHELWEKAVERFGDDAPSQGDIVRVLSQLHSAGVLLCDVTPDTEELFNRFEKTERNKWKMSLRSPLALRFPLFDPERILTRTMKYIKPLFSVYGAIVWVFIVGYALVLAGLHWPELTENIVDRVLSAENIILIWLSYPVIKALHEFSHGYAVKRWGGEVHEMGIMLLVLMPIPYVDASSASAFREKRRRIIVGAAGIMVELFVAALAMLLWASTEQGIVRSLAFNVMLVAGISTILFNGNPLLRYDGYYVLSDLVEVPNLAQRSINYLGYLIKRYVLGLKQTESPYVGPGERVWLATYSVAAFIYRIFIYTAIILFITGKFFIVGILLGIWAGISMFVIPVFKKIHFVLFNPALRENRVRAVMISGSLVLVVLAVLFILPFPSWTRTEGVVWVPEGSLVRSGTDCFIERMIAKPDTRVTKGDLLIECRDPLLVSNVRLLEAQLRELEARYNAEIYSDRVQAKITAEEMVHLRANLARARERQTELILYSPDDGVFIVPGAEDLPGRYIKQGALIAYVIDEERPTIRLIVSQSDIDLIRQRNKGIEIRLAERLDIAIPAVIKREVPGADERLPSAVLGNIGGGEIAIDPRDTEGLKTFEKLFQFDIEPKMAIGNASVGGRVYVRFDHGTEPLVFRWYRSLRRLFMRRFNV